MKKILITGGPVHAYFDDIKIITNRFKGGLMATLADQLHTYHRNDDNDADPVEITYLTSKVGKIPNYGSSFDHKKIIVIYHDGIDDYMKKVLEITPDMDAVVLGAAVANLIPKNKIEGKFPSHDYKVGDIIPIDFTIAPRIIDEVKKVNPKVQLFGFKLLENVDYYELIRAAYGVLLESKALTVFANDTKDLMQKYAVTKERGVHPMNQNDMAQWILNRMDEKYYSTIISETDKIGNNMEEALKFKKNKDFFLQLLSNHRNSFIKTDEGYIYGSGALWIKGEVFLTTSRGKNEIEDFSIVSHINHEKREIYCGTTKKASLNAPLFHYIFTNNCNVKYILHFHHQREDLITLNYATPGTDKDSVRKEIQINPSFNIKGHGCILSYNEKGELLK